MTEPWRGVGIIHRGIVIAEYCDDFDRADSPTPGILWTPFGDAGVAIDDNELVGAGSGIDGAMFNTLLTDDHYAEWDVSTGTDHSFYIRSSQLSGPNVAGWSTYEWFWGSASGGTWTLRYYSTFSSPTIISTFTGHPTPLATQMRFEVQGTTLRVKQDGVTIITTTDSNVVNGEYVGIRMDNPLMGVDNFCSGILL